MKLPQSALVKVAKIGILDNPVHIYGPKKYLIFGDHTVVEGTKLPVVMFDQHTYFGVVPYEETAPNVWECSIDHYRSCN